MDDEEGEGSTDTESTKSEKSMREFQEEKE